ncbi:hypothetical protein KSP39_PZI021192 [Platanthera zijinensis]|uniref:Uncharacterized protein n=1 Tax=Platanthera zijinensis TaxID=2320716 RepID=A0AAP0FWW2_9ASPA
MTYFTLFILLLTCYQINMIYAIKSSYSGGSGDNGFIDAKILHTWSISSDGPEINRTSNIFFPLLAESSSPKNASLVSLRRSRRRGHCCSLSRKEKVCDSSTSQLFPATVADLAARAHIGKHNSSL